MNRCTVYQHDTDIVDFEHVVTMMVEQLRFIGYDYDRKFVINVIDNAMKPEVARFCSFSMTKNNMR